MTDRVNKSNPYLSNLFSGLINKPFDKYAEKNVGMKEAKPVAITRNEHLLEKMSPEMISCFANNSVFARKI